MLFEFPRLAPGTYLLAVPATPWYAVHPMPAQQRKQQGRSPFGVEDSVDPSLDVDYPVTYLSWLDRFQPGVADRHLAEESDRHTLLIVADPFPTAISDAKIAIQKILDRGGRVIVTGGGAALLPKGQAMATMKSDSETCAARATRSDGPGGGVIEIRPSARWTASLPGQRVEYACEPDAVVVTYPAGKDTAVWWANSMPLENSEIAKEYNLSLLLHSIGPDPSVRVVWDESLHEDARGIWSYAEGTLVKVLWAQLALVSLLLLVSYSRRSGPLLPDPVVARDTQLEFVRSLGALYDKADATNVVVEIAYSRFRLLFGHPLAGSGNAGLLGTEDEFVSVVDSRVDATSAGRRPHVTAFRFRDSTR
jgi:hypothetical protein